MDEMEKNIAPVETGEEEVTKREEGQEEPKRGGYAPTKRNFMLWLVCGLYLMYNGYHLVRGFVVKEEGSGPIFLLCGIAFIGIGLFLSLSCYRMVSDKDKDKDKEGEEAAQQAPPSLFGGLFGGGSRAEEKAQEKPAGSSISQRARLAKDLGDVVETEGDTDEGN